MTATRGRTYRYVGPAELRALARPEAVGTGIASSADFGDWLADRPARETAEPFTFVVEASGMLRLAVRRSEHVVCAGGGSVLAAGEMGFREESGLWVVSEVSNQSTGYCPDVTSWTAVAEALDAAGIARPGGFTHAVVFRRCPGCGEVGIVRDEDYFCVFCGAQLPEEWNVDEAR
ncbi:hypothetical protein [Streptomyces sp. NPDC096339]|uniref:hypothetical protein n=1 Tax=Streptomyces sp. NPDC096339 TaxID=3366086 RepID=UPI0038306E77